MENLRIPPPIQGVFWGFIMWFISNYTSHLNHNFTGQKTLAFSFIGLGLLLDLISIITFIKTRTTVNPINIDRASELVTNGFYQISRNPMYLGLALVLIGWAILLGNLLNLIPFVLFIFVMTILQIKPEEAALKSKFGNAYEHYLKHVRRWI